MFHGGCSKREEEIVEARTSSAEATTQTSAAEPATETAAEAAA